MAIPILIEAPMPIRTPRLVIRPKQAGDGAANAVAVAETWSALQLWMPWARELGEFTAEQQEIRSRHHLADFMLRTEFNLVGLEHGKSVPVVWCSLYDMDWATRACRTGCWVRLSAQGRGIATETVNALSRYAFGALGMRRVGFTHSRGNEASERIAKKLGFSLEGIEREATLLPSGIWADKLCYGLLKTGELPLLDVRWGSDAS